ncbi:SLC13 family permease [Allokutzneria sp. A3M-2-11 16]|uniref:SLC13 family permease n=1 Tax=Allokutzneria sp. A3M-2-11 16 TaxID=2962043 RepID=UPI0020B7397A|nr:SLC13 family permease [Allokutzneria sp. A3M-2-11 16]MCP3799563.1 SLC13 family permease [Allokutzneria sp. A3M-2-11 16]
MHTTVTKAPVLRLLTGVLCLGTVAFLLVEHAPGLSVPGRVTLGVFAVAIAGWTLTKIDDTYIGLAAAVALVAIGVVSQQELFATLGDDTIWLLVAAFVLAAGVAATGLPTRVATAMASRARSVRGLAHLTTAALLASAFVIPSTSGRAALALPVFLALASALADRPRVVRALAILFPTVILLSAIASLPGAGAHLITSQLLANTSGHEIGFAHWMLLGLPFALVSSHSATELVLFLFTSRADRRQGLALELPTSKFSSAERRCAVLMLAVGVAWAAGAPATIVAVLAALIVTAPKFGTVSLNKALTEVPWPLLVFMASVTALGTGLSNSGAAKWLAERLLTGVSPNALLVVAVAVSTAAHLLVQSRSARSSVLIPLLIPAATAVGLNPAAVAFASTAAAGFCHTLPSSAKATAMFEGYRTADLVRLAVFLGPLTALLVLAFATGVWPHLGLPLR